MSGQTDNKAQQTQLLHENPFSQPWDRRASIVVRVLFR
ncbi:hypothetical protein AK972_4579 [Pseudomonas yamanorum]|nr:hypothetical protein AK972_4579 [Pseudomonas yamanorum]